MVSHRVAGAPLDFAALRSELEVPGDFPLTVTAEAEQAARALMLPDNDASELPFVTIDPAGSRDLDQAVHIERVGDGYTVYYAIADVAAFVAPGGAIDVEANQRGETLYFPDARVPLHPPLLSEDRASLLPGQLRPAVLWQITLDRLGEVSAVQVTRARVRSRQQWDYAGVQRMLAGSDPPEGAVLLAEVGVRRRALARARHAINLDLPEQTVDVGAEGGWTLGLREPLPVELFNAEISLLTGMCAAGIMLDAEVGILRTVPPPDEGAIHALRRAARALGVDWPAGAHPGDVLDDVDRGNPKRVAFIEHAVALLRGAGYVTFDGARPAQPLHAGIGAPYAHVTAPLRRLVDRYATEICLAVSAGRSVPAWVRAAFPALPDQMRRADQRAHDIDRAVVDATEAWLLRDRVGARFSAVVIDADKHAGTIVVDDPPVRARCDGAALPVGERIAVRLTVADVATRTVRFARAAG
jgi:exoribonuclease R